jgi:hypothetical protein
MIVDRDGEGPFGEVLADDVFIEFVSDFDRFRNAEGSGAGAGFLRNFFIEDVFANVDAAIADVDSGTGDEFSNLGMALSAE